MRKKNIEAESESDGWRQGIENCVRIFNRTTNIY